MATGRRHRHGLGRVAAAALVLVLLPACTPAPPERPAEAVPRTAPSPSSSAVPTAREARPGASEEVRFVPTQIALEAGTTAPVVPVPTDGLELAVPEDVDHVGWWDGSAYVGDPFGAIVIAGHVDSTDQGLGFFHRLWTLGEGATVVLSAGPDEQRYQVHTVRRVDRTDLVDDDQALSQRGPARLVLITCVGEFRPEDGGYQQNLLVIADPVS